MEFEGILNFLSKKNISPTPCWGGVKRLILIILLLSMCNCAPARLRKVFFGLAPYDVENAKVKQEQIFDLDSSACFTKAIAIFDKWGVNLLYRNKKKGFIVAYGFKPIFDRCTDATEVGLLIKSVEEGKTELTLASENHKLAQFISEKLFKELKSPKKNQ